jgi:dolichol-phosphate mannosyltransferase
VVPTYDERENLALAIDEIHGALAGAHVLVVDDNSPDGTGQLADELAQADPRVHVLHRPGKQGLGRAYLAGFEWALSRDYDPIFEMDADGSHQAKHLPELLSAVADSDVALGSRWVDGGGAEGWSRFREAVSRGGSLYSRIVLGLPIRDLTGGFKCFRRHALEALDLETVASEGFAFQIEMTDRALRRGLRVVEVPITFLERRAGQSKMSGSIFVEALFRVWQIRLRRR